MSARLRNIARETVEAVERGHYSAPDGRRVEIAADVAAAVAGTRLYLPGDDLPGPPDGPARRPHVEVTGESTLEAARRLGGDVAALVFASARNPGGGFLTGAQAQEESLARASALYASLTSAREFYTAHRADPDLRYSDRVIRSPRVPVFRDDRGAWLNDPYPVTFLTAAAPNAGAVRRSQPRQAATVPEVLLARARRVLDIAEASGDRRLVLGAWGCGVFQNVPAEVAAAFAGALAGRTGFDQVTFAIHETRKGAPTLEAFRRALG